MLRTELRAHVIETIEFTGLVSVAEYHLERVLDELIKFAEAWSISPYEVDEAEFWTICEVHLVK